MCAAGRTEVFGGDGLEADNLQSSGSQNQLATPRVEVLQNHNRTVFKHGELDDRATRAAAERQVTAHTCLSNKLHSFTQ